MPERLLSERLWMLRHNILGVIRRCDATCASGQSFHVAAQRYVAPRDYQFLSGESTISKVFVPLRPTSSSCLNLDDGGYLCQPRSSSMTGALTRSKLPRPEIVDVTVMGSPSCTVFGFASVVIVKFPIAPEKLGGACGGNGFTSSATGSLLISTSRRSPS